MAKKRSTKKRLRALEQRLLTLEHEHAGLAKRMKKLAKRVEGLADPKLLFGKAKFDKAKFDKAKFDKVGFKKFEMPFPGPGGPNFFWRRPGGGPPWRKQFGPVVSLEVPLETGDPSAPLWATVTARLPEEITTVGDDGGIVRYRYSAVGSTPQAPRYRRIAEPEEPFLPTGPPTP